MTAPVTTAAGPFGPPHPWVFVDGELVRDACVSVHAHALSYGTGTFEGIRGNWSAEHEQLYLLEPGAHYARMQASARVLGRELPLTVEELVAATLVLLRRNDVRHDVYLRPLFVLAGEELPVRMHGVSSRLSIAATPIVGDYIGLGGVRCKVSTWRRAPDYVLPGRAKLCGSYAGPALAKTEAVAAGYDEAIMLNTRGSVAEGTTSNLLLRRGEEWITPPVDDDILEGITRAQVLRLLHERTGRAVTERSVQRTELYVCDELLLCGTAALVAPVISVDDRLVGDGRPGPTTLAVLDDLQAIARRGHERHHGWTTPVHP